MPVKRTALELYIQSYLRQNIGFRNVGRKYVEKAITLIDLKLGILCCGTDDEVVTYSTQHDNTFTHTIRMILNTIPSFGFRKSLERSKAMLEKYLFCCPAIIPSAGTVNDTTNTFTFTIAPGYTIADYEYTLDGGITYVQATSTAIPVGDVTKAPGQVGVRIKQGSTSGKFHEASPTVFNTTAFNAGVAPTAPTTPVTDNTLNTFSWTDTGGKTFADAEYTVNGGTSYVAATAKPQTGITGIHAIGQVGVRYKAAGGNPPSTTLFNLVAFT